MAKDLTIIDTKLAWKEPQREPEIWAQVLPVSQGYQTPAQNARPSTPVRVYPSRVVQAIPIKKIVPESVNQLLSDAADYLEKDGIWCQNALGNDNQVCAVGAMLRMETGDANENYQPTQPYRHPLTTAAVEKLSKYLSSKKVRIPYSRDPDSDPHFDHVSNWNDTNGRTKSDIVKTLREASER